MISNADIERAMLGMEDMITSSIPGTPDYQQALGARGILRWLTDMDADRGRDQSVLADMRKLRALIYDLAREAA